MALFNHSRGNDGDKEERQRGYSTVLAPSGQILIAKLNFAVYQPKKGEKNKKKGCRFHISVIWTQVVIFTRAKQNKSTVITVSNLEKLTLFAS